MITENLLINENFSWIDVEHPLRPDFDFLKEHFHLPSLLLQDCMRSEHLPKYEKTDRGHFFLLRLHDPTSSEADITVQKMTNKLAIFITEDRIMTIHSDELYHLRRYSSLKNTVGFPNTFQGLAHQLFLTVIHSFEESIKNVQNLYEGFEKDILSQSGQSPSNARVYLFRRQLFVIKGILQLTQNALNQSRGFWEENNPSLFQDLKENIGQLYFRLDDLAHNFDQLFALHLSINDQKNNEVMKILTVFASIMLPLTFIASFYGMNFNHLPGLNTTSGLIGAILIMATVTFVITWYFGRKQWFKLM